MPLGAVSHHKPAVSKSAWCLTQTGQPYDALLGYNYLATSQATQRWDMASNEPSDPVPTDTYLIAQVRALRLQPGLQQCNLTRQGFVFCLQALLATVEGGHIPGLLIPIDILVEVTVET